MQRVRTGRAWLGEAPSPCRPGPPGFSRLLLFYPCENAGSNPAGKSTSLWFTQPGSLTLCWWDRGETQGEAPCPPLPHWVLRGMSRAPAPPGRGCTRYWHHVLLSPCWAECKESPWRGVCLDGARCCPGVTHPGAHPGCRSWPGQGMLLSPCSSPVTNPSHPPSPTMPHPVVFLPSPAWGAGKLGTVVAVSRHSPSGFPVLGGALGSFSQEPQRVQGLLPIGAHIALAQEDSCPGGL